MSITQLRSELRSVDMSAVLPAKVTTGTLLDKKHRAEPITALTAYDYAFARIVDEAGVDMVLVGDSLAMVVMGLDSTLAVTMEEMLHHTRAARRAVKRALLVADMPFGSYQSSVEQGVANAVRFLKEAGAEGVKIEGPRPGLVERLTGGGDSGGRPPRSHAAVGPPHGRLQGAGQDAQRRQGAPDGPAKDLEQAGICALVLEGMPRELAAEITADSPSPPSASARDRIATDRSSSRTTCSTSPSRLPPSSSAATGMRPRSSAPQSLPSAKTWFRGNTPAMRKATICRLRRGPRSMWTQQRPAARRNRVPAH